MITTSSPALPDPRLNAYRPDLAALSLKGIVERPRYAKGICHQVRRGAAAVRQRPLTGAGLDTEALFGEMVMVYEIVDNWAWGQLQRDDYVGYLPAAALESEIAATTHLVSAIGTFVYPDADIKSPPQMHLSIGCELSVAERGERFSRLTTGGYIVNRHIAEIGHHARDFVEIAERVIGTPYLWGGRTRVGLDCSGLLQICLQAAGRSAPRDSDMQEASIGTRLPERQTSTLDGLQRGDLVFWSGHVGIMSDSVMMVHANAHHMAVAVEPVQDAASRILKTGGAVTSVKRVAATGIAASS